jgi:uncharacterized protein YrzB (UPF0473 family)
MEIKMNNHDSKSEADGYVMRDGETVQDSIRITMERPDGTKQEFDVMGIFTEDVFQYMALAPVDPDDMDIVILPYEEGSKGEVVFRDFYSDEEYQAAAEAFDRLFNDDPDEDLTVMNPEDIASESELSDEDYEQL